MELSSLSGQSAAKPLNLSTPSVAQEKEIPAHAGRASEESTESRSAKSSEGEAAAPSFGTGENRATNPDAAIAAGQTKGAHVDVAV